MSHPCFHSSRSRLSRRDFLKLAGSATLGTLLAACGGRSAGQAPTPTFLPAGASPTPEFIPTGTPPPPTQTYPLPTPRTYAGTSCVAIEAAASYERALVRQQVQAALEAIGGIGDVVQGGDTVAIKVNLTGGPWFDSPHGVPRTEDYWTHPEVVRALCELLRDAGARKLYIVEAIFSPDSFSIAGYDSLTGETGATLVDLNGAAPFPSFTSFPVGEGWMVYDHFDFNPLLENVDAFISVPKMKCHWCCGVTLGLKNLVGIGPVPRYSVEADDGTRTQFHSGPDGREDFRQRLPRVVIDLNRARPVDLTLVDAISTSDGGEGPWWQTNLQRPNLLLAGKDTVAVDAVSTAVMGFDPTLEPPDPPFLRGVNHLNLAALAGLGNNRLEQIEVVGLPISEAQTHFKASLD